MALETQMAHIGRLSYKPRPAFSLPYMLRCASTVMTIAWYECPAPLPRCAQAPITLPRYSLEYRDTSGATCAHVRPCPHAPHATTTLQQRRRMSRWSAQWHRESTRRPPPAARRTRRACSLRLLTLYIARCVSSMHARVLTPRADSAESLGAETPHCPKCAAQCP